MTSVFQDYSQDVKRLYTEILTKIEDLNITVFHDKDIQERFVWYVEIHDKLDECLSALNKSIEYYNTVKKRNCKN